MKIEKCSAESRKHILALTQALQKEYLFEKQSYEKMRDKKSLQKRIDRGECWYPCRSISKGYNALNQPIVELQRQGDTEIEHAFEYGRPVVYFTQNAKGDICYGKRSGKVSYVDNERMVVALNSMDDASLWFDQEVMGVQLEFDERSYRLQFEALKRVEACDSGRLAHLREVLMGSEATQWHTAHAPSFPWLNRSQNMAVQKVLQAKDVAVVHGPPGTGKTTTLLDAISETLRRENQVLVSAQSNIAVDWISRQLIDRGLSVLRIGNPLRVDDTLLEHTYEGQFERHPLYIELWSVRRTIRRMQQQGRRLNDYDKIEQLRERGYELEHRIMTDLFSQNRIIASTLIGAGSPLLEQMHFSTLFIDEAAQATEPACMVAICKANRVVMAGDHWQLPPTIKSDFAPNSILSKTLMERVVEKHREAVVLLTDQYRMHSDLMRFSSEWFYEGRLHTAKGVDSRPFIDYEKRLTWFDTSENDYPERVLNQDYGRMNSQEADALVKQLEEYVHGFGIHRVLDEGIDFGIITPYRAQKYYLKRAIQKSYKLKRLRHLIRINTIDGFQGQECDVIMMSLVRSNAHGQIGFLNDLRRMNVAMTRARHKLMVVANAKTLTNHKFYAALYAYFKREGEVIVLQTDSSEVTI